MMVGFDVPVALPQL